MKVRRPGKGSCSPAFCALLNRGLPPPVPSRFTAWLRKRAVSGGHREGGGHAGLDEPSLQHSSLGYLVPARSCCTRGGCELQ